MSNPFKDSKPLSGILSETIGAISSLNMYPAPVVSYDGSGYLSETDANAKHSIEHLQQVVQYANVAVQKIESLKWIMHKLAMSGEINGTAMDQLYDALKELV